MIRPLRRRHRFVITALALALPIAFGLALGARPDFPRQELAPRTAAPQSLGDDLFPQLEVAVQRAGDRRLRVSGADSGHPELLLYLTAQPPEGSTLPPEARLLGPGQGLPPRLVDLPAQDDHGGWLVLYSLGHGRVVAHRPFPGGTP